jgi:PAS domain S-box-containing protein
MNPMDEKAIQILLIEDNPGDVRLIREMLRGVNGFRFEIYHADRLQAGLERLSPPSTAHSPLDVVLLDLTLPDSSGYETFTRLHRHPCNLPIVLLTGLDDEELGMRAIADGAQDYLMKNKLDDELLARALRYAIERKRAADALRHSEQLFEKMYSGLRDAVLLFDADTRRIFDCNPAAAQIFGFQQDEIIQKKLESLFTNPRLGELHLSRLSSQGYHELIGPLYEAEMQRKGNVPFFA